MVERKEDTPAILLTPRESRLPRGYFDRPPWRDGVMLVAVLSTAALVAAVIAVVVWWARG